MKIVVDVMPIQPQDCIFSEFARVVEDSYLEQLEEEYGEVDICEGCGGVIVDEEHILEVYLCHLTKEECDLMRYGACECLRGITI